MSPDICGLFYFEVAFDERDGLRRAERITRSPQEAHSSGRPCSQREKRGFSRNRPVLSVAAVVPADVGPESCPACADSVSAAPLLWRIPALSASSARGVAQVAISATAARSPPPDRRPNCRFLSADSGPPVGVFGVGQADTSATVLRLESLFPASL